MVTCPVIHLFLQTSNSSLKHPPAGPDHHTCPSVFMGLPCGWPSFHIPLSCSRLLCSSQSGEGGRWLGRGDKVVVGGVGMFYQVLLDVHANEEEQVGVFIWEQASPAKPNPR